MIKSFKQFIEEKSNQIKIPKGSLGIARDQMPQIESKSVPAFIKFLKSQGVNTNKMPMSISTLKLTQSEINKDKVRKMIDSAPEDALSKPIIISKDNFILDGHHRFVALLNINPNKKLMSYHVDVNMDILLGLAKNFPKSFTKGINENV